MPVVWMRLVRDARPPFGRAAQSVLICLGLRMNREGRGYASHETLAADAKVGVRTAERATAGARRRGYLVQIHRGHRRGDGSTVATEWELKDPAEPATVDGLSEPLPATVDGLSGPVSVTTARLSGPQPAKTASQPVSRGGPRGLSTKRSKRSSAARDIIREHTDASNDEAEAVLAALHQRPDVRSVARLVRHIADVDPAELRDLVAKARAAATAARRRDDERQKRRNGWPCPCGCRDNRTDSSYCRWCGQARSEVA